METEHRVVVGDARSLSELDDDAVELVVTSPPYPMIEMWDDLFTELDPAIGDHLDADDGQAAFDAMHEQLHQVWQEVDRVLVDGGIACINVGDATRKIGESFRVYQNHSRIVDQFESLDFEPLPEILWRKPANSSAKFMGSGMLPPNAYVTLEHEYILLFRNGEHRREFEPGSKRRYNSAFFWEERNQWFSDVWTDLRGNFQKLDNDDLRDRSAAFPFEVPYRLVNMFSVYGDTVLDPFWGTGTTSLAAMTAGRSSVGYELRESFTEVFKEQVANVPTVSRTVVEKRLSDHLAFVQEKVAAGETFDYEADYYDFPVTTNQEKPMLLYTVDAVEQGADGYTVRHEPVESSEGARLDSPSSADAQSDPPSDR